MDTPVLPLGEEGTGAGCGHGGREGAVAQFIGEGIQLVGEGQPGNEGDCFGPVEWNRARGHFQANGAHQAVGGAAINVEIEGAATGF